MNRQSTIQKPVSWRQNWAAFRSKEYRSAGSRRVAVLHDPVQSNWGARLRPGKIKTPNTQASSGKVGSHKAPARGS